MDKLQEYVAAEFLELAEKHWSEMDIRAFIEQAIQLDTDVYEVITAIEHDTLYQHIAEFDHDNVNRELASIEKAMLANAKDEIKEMLSEIEAIKEDEAEFGTGIDAEYRRNGFASEADFWSYKNG